MLSQTYIIFFRAFTSRDLLYIAKIKT